eukprot:5786596-Pyramimonas_sp.AAC.1
MARKLMQASILLYESTRTRDTRAQACVLGTEVAGGNSGREGMHRGHRRARYDLHKIRRNAQHRSTKR